MNADAVKVFPQGQAARCQLVVISTVMLHGLAAQMEGYLPEAVLDDYGLLW